MDMPSYKTAPQRCHVHHAALQRQAGSGHDAPHMPCANCARPKPCPFKPTDPARTASCSSCPPARTGAHARSSTPLPQQSRPAPYPKQTRSNDALVRDPRRREKHTRRVPVRKCVCERDRHTAQEPWEKGQDSWSGSGSHIARTARFLGHLAYRRACACP
jgi:hypothetical protein